MPDGKQYGFERTVCACDACSKHCTTRPGVLAPGDFEQIAGNLRVPFNFAMHYFRASPGAMVMLGGKACVQIPTITPRLDPEKGCVFLKDGKCDIHAVAPYGCSHFDDHMDAVEGDFRSLAVHKDIATNEKYQMLRECIVQVERRRSRALRVVDNPDDLAWDKVVDGVRRDIED